MGFSSGIPHYLYIITKTTAMKRFAVTVIKSDYTSNQYIIPATNAETACSLAIEEEAKAARQANWSEDDISFAIYNDNASPEAEERNSVRVMDTVAIEIPQE